MSTSELEVVSLKEIEKEVKRKQYFITKELRECGLFGKEDYFSLKPLLKEVFENPNYQTEDILNTLKSIYLPAIRSVIHLYIIQRCDIAQREQRIAKIKHRLPRVRNSNWNGILMNVVLNALTQVGKNNIGQLCQLLFPLLDKALYNKNTVAIVVFPGKDALETQYEENMSVLTSCFSLSEVVIKGKTTLLKDVLDEIKKKSLMNFEEYRAIKASNGKDKLKQIKTIRFKLKNAVDNIIYFCDESDYGSNKGGMLHKITDDESISIVLSTGTNFEGLALIKKSESTFSWQIMDVWIEEGYSGPIWACGRQANIFSGFTEKPVFFATYESFFKIKEYEMDYTLVYSEKKYYNDKRIPLEKNKRNEDTHNQFQENYYNNICHMIYKSLDDSSPHNIEYGHNGVALRFKDNTTCEKIAKEVERRMKNLYPNFDVQIIQHHTSNGDKQRSTIKNTIIKASSKKYALFVSAAARRGDVLPSMTFINLSNSSDMCAQLQGFFGRATGYNKSSRYFCTKKDFLDLKNHIQYKGTKYDKKCSPRINYTEEFFSSSSPYADLHFMNAISRLKDAGLTKQASIFEKIQQEMSYVLKDGEKASSDLNSAKLRILIDKLSPLIELHCDVIFERKLRVIRFSPNIISGLVKTASDFLTAKDQNGSFIFDVEAKAKMLPKNEWDEQTRKYVHCTKKGQSVLGLNVRRRSIVSSDGDANGRNWTESGGKFICYNCQIFHNDNVSNKVVEMLRFPVYFDSAILTNEPSLKIEVNEKSMWYKQDENSSGEKLNVA